MSLNLQVMSNSLIAILDNNTTVILPSTDPRYRGVLKVLSEGFDESKIRNILFFIEDEIEEEIEEEEDLEDEECDEQEEEEEEEEEEEALEEQKEIKVDRIKIDIEKDTITIDNIEMPDSLKNKFLDLKRRHKPRSYLLRFWDKLQENPSRNSIKMLYRFLDHNGHIIMADGDFIAYKAVTTDLLDHHTKTNKHKVGCVIKMDREKVNPNPNETCASGLHIASWEYLKDFHPENSRYFEVLVNPKDVVAVPNDYDGTKCRVARYKVYREVKFERGTAWEDVKKLQNKLRKKIQKGN